MKISLAATSKHFDATGARELTAGPAALPREPEHTSLTPAEIRQIIIEIMG